MPCDLAAFSPGGEARHGAATSASPARSLASASGDAAPVQAPYQWSSSQDGVSSASSRRPSDAASPQEVTTPRDRSTHRRVNPGRQGAASRAPKDVSRSKDSSRSIDSGKPRGGSRRQHTQSDHRHATVRSDMSPGEAERLYEGSDADSASAASPQLRPTSGKRRGRGSSVRSGSASSTALAFESGATTPDPPVVIQLNVQRDGTVRLSEAAAHRDSSGKGHGSCASGNGISGNGLGGFGSDNKFEGSTLHAARGNDGGSGNTHGSDGAGAQGPGATAHGHGRARHGGTVRTSGSSAGGNRKKSGSIEQGTSLSGKFGSGSGARDSSNSGAAGNRGVGDDGVHGSIGGKRSAPIDDSSTARAQLWEPCSLDDTEGAVFDSARLPQQQSQARSGGEAEPGYALRDGGRGQSGADGGTWDPRSEAAQQPYSTESGGDTGVQTIICPQDRSLHAYVSPPL